MIERHPVTFTIQELWLLHDFARHECPDMERWKFPPADLELNEEIAEAIHACSTDNLQEYTLDLTHQHLLVIDFVIRHDYKTPEGAKGRDILLKTFAARAALAGLRVGSLQDRTYQEANIHAQNEGGC